MGDGNTAAPLFNGSERNVSLVGSRNNMLRKRSTTHKTIQAFSAHQSRQPSQKRGCSPHASEMNAQSYTYDMLLAVKFKPLKAWQPTRYMCDPETRRTTPMADEEM